MLTLRTYKQTHTPTEVKGTPDKEATQFIEQKTNNHHITLKFTEKLRNL